MSTELTFNKTVAHDLLRKELEVALGEDIVDNMGGTPTSVTIYFTRNTTGAEDVTITQVVTDHVPTHLSYKIWDFVVDKPYAWKSPVDLDYKKGLSTRLHPKNVFVQGELQSREYYETATIGPLGGVTFSNLILKEENVYVRSANGFAIYKDQTITWIREDESEGPDIKAARKYYSGIDQMQEGQKRRTNLIDQLMIDVLTFMVTNQTIVRIGETGDPQYQLTPAELDVLIVAGRDLLSSHASAFADFKTHSDKQIITDITNDTTNTLLDDIIYGSDPAMDIRT